MVGYESLTAIVLVIYAMYFGPVAFVYKINFLFCFVLSNQLPFYYISFTIKKLNSIYYIVQNLSILIKQTKNEIQNESKPIVSTLFLRESHNI